MCMPRKKYWREMRQDVNSDILELWDFWGFLFPFLYFPVYNKYLKMSIYYPYSQKKNEHYSSSPKAARG